MIAGRGLGVAPRAAVGWGHHRETAVAGQNNGPRAMTGAV